MDDGGRIFPHNKTTVLRKTSEAPSAVLSVASKKSMSILSLDFDRDRVIGSCISYKTISFRIDEACKPRRCKATHPECDDVVRNVHNICVNRFIGKRLQIVFNETTKKNIRPGPHEPKNRDNVRV